MQTCMVIMYYVGHTHMQFQWGVGMGGLGIGDGKWEVGSRGNGGKSHICARFKQMQRLGCT